MQAVLFDLPLYAATTAIFSIGSPDIHPSSDPYGEIPDEGDVLVKAPDPAADGGLNQWQTRSIARTRGILGRSDGRLSNVMSY